MLCILGGFGAELPKDLHENYTTNAISLSENISGCSLVSRWDSVEQTYKTFVVGGPPTFDFMVTRGMGFFVYVDVESVWHGEG